MKSPASRLENEITGFIPGSENMFIWLDIFCSFMRRRSIPIRCASGTSSVSRATAMKLRFMVSITSGFEKSAYEAFLFSMSEMLPMCTNIILSSLMALLSVASLKGFHFISPLRSSFMYGDAVLYIVRLQSFNFIIFVM